VLAGQTINSFETRTKVLAAAERLRYRPNLLVQGMQTGKTRMIGVMAAPFDFYWSEVLYGIHDVLTAADHVPIMVWTAHDGPGPRRRNAPGSELPQIHRLLDRRIDAVILWPPFASLFKEHVDEFSSRDIPVVTIDHELPAEFRADYVGTDEGAGGRMVAEHLLGLGHRRFGHLAGPADLTWALRRREAFEGALAKVRGTSCVTIEANLLIAHQGIEQARALLRLANRPTAIFAATDPLAKAVYYASREMNLKIPDDLSVVGYADDDFAQDMEPPLTTARQSGYEIGRRAAELAVGRSMETVKDRGIIRSNQPVELVVRSSTAALCR
jgi:LacI family transcriptional regulator